MQRPVRKLAAIGFSFAAAIFISEYLLPRNFIIVAFCILALFSVIFLLIKSANKMLLVFICVGMSLGFAWDFAYKEVVVAPAEEFAGYEGTVSAVAIGYSEETDYGARISVKIDTGERSVKANLYIRGNYVHIGPGDILEFETNVRSSSKISGEETDVFTSKGIFLSAYTDAVSVKGHKDSITYLPVKVNQAMKEKLSELFSKDTIAMVQAMLTGDKTFLYDDSELTKSMQIIGIYHTMAVSGMHVSFLVGLVMSVFGGKKRAGAAVCIPVIIAFMAIMGNVPSVVRAGIMQIIVLLAPLMNREADSATSLALALMILLAANPVSIRSAGLQFSFAATAGILMFTGYINAKILSKVRKTKIYKNKLVSAVIRFVVGSISVTIGGSIFTMPLSAIYFGYVSVLAPLANLLLIWLISFIFSMSIICVIVSFIVFPAGQVMAIGISVAVRIVREVSVALADIPFAAVYMNSTVIICWLVLVYLFFGLYLLKRNKINIILPICATVMTLCVALVIVRVAVDSSELTLTALDVGQGQSIVLNSGKYTVLVDCGGSDFESAGDTAAEYVYGQCGNSIDLLILTHFHADHANGVEDLIERIDVESIAVPQLEDEENSYYSERILTLAKERDIDIIYVTEDMQISFGNSVLTIYAPIGKESENEKGLSVLCTNGDYDILITGDMNDEIERRLMMSQELPDIEVLVVGHHGSKYSTCEELLDTIKPEIAAISVGYNSYGHPTEEVLERLSDRDILVYRTDLSGNIIIRKTGD